MYLYNTWAMMDAIGVPLAYLLKFTFMKIDKK